MIVRKEIISMAFDPAAASRHMMEGYLDAARPMEDMLFVKGKVGIVTGGTSGLGFNISLRLLQGGANLVVASYSEVERDAAIPLFEKAGFGEDRVRFCKTNVADEEDVKNLVAFTDETFGTIDFFVNSVGVWNYAHIYDMAREDFARVLDVNVVGLFLCIKHISKYIIDHEIAGKITAISSNVPWLPYPVFGGYPHYAASKGAVNALIVEAAKELKRFNIMVNGVAPGGMSTPGATQNMCAGNLTEEQEEEMYDEIGIWQTDGPSPVDTVAIVAYTLCTAVSDGMTGELVVADGGMSHNIVRFQPEIMQYPED